ncbi:MAG: hypothetical protein ACLU4N_00145 [Butyricimonas faecihominis]
MTGYGDFKSSYTGSASVVNMDKMKSLPVVSVTQMLEANLGSISLFKLRTTGSNVSMRIRVSARSTHPMNPCTCWTVFRSHRAT